MDCAAGVRRRANLGFAAARPSSRRSPFEMVRRTLSFAARNTAHYSGPSLRPKMKAKITPTTPVTAQPGNAREA